MKNEKPLVSVIIPTYNRSTYILEAITSSLGQTHNNCEIIIIDDGSTENTKAFISQYLSNPKIKYFFQKNSGVSSARNKGLKESTGKYIQFLDSDDLISNKKIEKQVAFLEVNKKFFGVYCDTYYFNRTIDNLITTYRKFEIRSGSLLNRLTSSNFIPVNSMLIRKPDVFFDELLTVSEDWDFWLRLSLQNKEFSCIDEKLNYVRIHENNMSKNRNRMLKGELAVLDKLEQSLPNSGKMYYAKFSRYKKLKVFDAAIANLQKAVQHDNKYRLKYYRYLLKFKIIKRL